MTRKIKKKSKKKLGKIINKRDQNKYKERIKSFIGKIRYDRYHRFKSWDIIFGYIKKNKKNRALLIKGNKKELTCLHVSSYLASWGMYRGSSQLLKSKNYRVYEQLLVILFSKKHKHFWKLKLKDFDKNNKKRFSFSRKVLNLLINDVKMFCKEESISYTNTLITKILLALWGQTLALDTFIKRGLKNYGIRQVFNVEFMSELCEFYIKNKNYWDKLYKKYNWKYPIPKLIDMAFFIDENK